MTAIFVVMRRCSPLHVGSVATRARLPVALATSKQRVLSTAAPEAAKSTAEPLADSGGDHPRELHTSLTPRAIVEELDKHIVGQAAAKRAVAIALRNRWRRQLLGEELKVEIVPRNLLMIGPTGKSQRIVSALTHNNTQAVAKQKSLGAYRSWHKLHLSRLKRLSLPRWASTGVTWTKSSEIWSRWQLV